MQGYGHISILTWRRSPDLPLIESWLSFVLTPSLNYESGILLPSWAHVSLVECGSSSQEGHAFRVLLSSAVALTDLLWQEWGEVGRWFPVAGLCPWILGTQGCCQGTQQSTPGS